VKKIIILLLNGSGVWTHSKKRGASEKPCD
jgi:hypothetical protein